MSGEADLGLFGAIRILSADVAVDPVFGLTGYGCDVSQAGACLNVTPTHGVFKRLNLISQKLSMRLDRDRYSAATVSASNDSIAFTLQNQRPGSPHTTHVTLIGLMPGTYPVSVGGAAAGTLTATTGAPAVLALSVGTRRPTPSRSAPAARSAPEPAADPPPAERPPPREAPPRPPPARASRPGVTERPAGVAA